MIRFAQKKDAAEIAPLIMVILKDMELPFLLKYGEEKTLVILKEAITDPNYRYSYSRGLVEEREGKIAGVAFGYTDEEESVIDEPLKAILKKNGINVEEKLFLDHETFPNEWYLDSISVSKEFRGQGIGSALISALPKLAKKSNREIIGLSVDEMNPKAKKLYERHGFEVVGKRQISGHLYDHMQKRINNN
ncbi:GNAT family acetyltransferase [Enterococcus sp. 10A9_DIV0425]|uniref:GNAT family acetyltransferase n=1 Tax=Candidatus Enterococcus wittei TaxID=1987383 RepID=A0A242JXR7_9ENTE|nr:GNAT family N-acetyltransferase [Enterococcus sp. 10A9_DIV0425]OTP10114.1 GNAT family acetyltransferase [Enterococcus sp. 10A9_DIV0425]THE14268.1 GNAT family N-acetyltransferase [Enterococcus hirae]